MIGDFGAREIYRRILASAENDTEVVLQAARGVDGQEQSALEGSIFRVSKDAEGLEAAAWQCVDEIDRHLKKQ